MSKHDAVGPAAGYLFQPEKALLRLAKAPRLAFVGVETGDDVVEMQDGKVRESEQLKNAVDGQGNPFADRSIGLWKTLSIWLNTHTTDPSRLTCSYLILSTNRALPTKCLARTLADAVEPDEIHNAIKTLRAIGLSPSESIAKFVKCVLDSSDDELSLMIKRIRLDDGPSLTTSIPGDTIEYLQLPTNVDAMQIYNSLLGWLVQTLKALWDSGEPGWISGEAFANQKQAAIDQCRRESFSARAARSISVSPSELNSKRDELFVRQLQLIELDEEEMLDAISEMIRESKEVLRLFKNGVITRSEFHDRDQRLHSRWIRIFKRQNRLSQRTKEEQIGYEIFDETTDCNESIGAITPCERYMTAGALHRLANDPKSEIFIGWHPRFKELLTFDGAE